MIFAPVVVTLIGSSMALPVILSLSISPLNVNSSLYKDLKSFENSQHNSTLVEFQEAYQMNFDLNSPVFLLDDGSMLQKTTGYTNSTADFEVINAGCKYHKGSEISISNIVKIPIDDIFQCRHRPYNSKKVVYLIAEKYLNMTLQFDKEMKIDTDKFLITLQNEYGFVVPPSRTTTSVEIFHDVPIGKTAHVEFHGYRYEVLFKQRTVFTNECDSRFLPDLKGRWKNIKAYFPTVGELELIWGVDCPLGFKDEIF